jgi:hypothetical protein
VRNHRFFRVLFFSLLLFSFWQNTYAQTTRLGNFFTLEEKAFWRVRANLDAGVDQYKAKGDVQSNSPGDWDRIVANKNVWVSNPAADRYENFFRGCSTCAFPKMVDNVNPYDTDDGYFMVHAAFYAFLANDATLKTQIRNEIMAHVVNETYTSSTGETNVKAFDFYNTRRWASRTFGDLNPGFGIAEWLERVLFSYQLTSAEGSAYSDQDKADIIRMFKGAWYFFKTNYDFDADGLFVNRAAENYALSTAALNHENDPNDTDEYLYTDATGTRYKPRYASRSYSNRRATMAAFVGHAGIATREQPLIESAVKYFKELIRFGIYPNGVYVDFLRLTSTNPQKGFAYSANGQLLLFAECLARTGDFRLYDYETTAGTTASVAGTMASSDGVTKKGIRMFLLAQCRLWNHQQIQTGAPLLYGTDSPSVATGASKNNYLIDGTNELNGDKAVWFAYMVFANCYYKDAYIESTILRSAPGAEAYPSSPQKSGNRDAWTGGIMPAWMMLGAKRQAGSGAPNQYPGTITLTPQTISFTAIPNKTYGDASFTLTATAPGGTVVFSSSDVTKATVSGNTVTIKGAGNVVIYANQGGNSSYFPAPQTSQGFTIAKKGLVVDVLDASRPYNKVNQTFGISYSGFVGSETSTVLTVQPTITTTATQASAPGTYAITASNGSALNYALSYLPGTLTVTKGTVSFNVTANLNRLTSDGPWTFSTTLYEEGTTNVITGVALVYSKISGTSVTSINSSTGLVTLSGTAGNSIIQVANAANPYYFQWNTQRQVTVTASSKTAQTITFNPLPAVTYGSSAGTLSATATSGLSPTFESSDPNIASISGTTITYLKAGVVNIIAHQLGDATYEIAPDIIRQLTISKKALTVTADDKTRAYGAQNPDFTYVIDGYIAGEDETDLTTLPIATTAATTTSPVGAYAITPSGGSADNYSFTYVPGQLSITQATQAITFPTISDHGVTEVPFQLNATSSSGLAVTYSIVSGPATVSSSGLVTLAGTAGTVTVRAAQAGNINYSAASTVDQSFAAIDPSPQQNQTITVVDPGAQVYAVGATFPFAPTANSQLVVTTTVVSGPATILSGTVTITGAGTIILKSVQAGDDDYYPAQDVFTTVLVNKARQVISSTLIEDKYISAGTFSVTATAPAGTVVLTANNKLTQNTSTTFTPLALGQAIITAIQPGNANYIADTLLLTFNIVPSPTTGSINILEGLSIYSGYYNLGTGENQYSTYYLWWPSLGGTFSTTRVVLESGTDRDGNVITGNILDNFKLWRWNGSEYVIMLDVTGNTRSTYDATLANVAVTDKVFITATGKDIRNKNILRRVWLYGVEQ